MLKIVRLTVLKKEVKSLKDKKGSILSDVCKKPIKINIDLYYYFKLCYENK